MSQFDASDAASVIAKAADIAIILDSAGVVADVAVNAPVLARCGATGWVGRSFSDIVTLESKPKVEALLTDGLSGLRRWRQLNHPIADGEDVPVEYVPIHIAADGSRIIAGRELTGVATLQQRLVAAQQAMEREYARVRSAETRYRLLFQETAEAVLIVDAVSERVVEANPAALALFDAKPARSSGIAFASLLHPNSVTSAQTLLTTVRVAGKGDEAVVHSAEGRPIALGAALFNQGGKSFFLVRAVAASGGADEDGARPPSRVAEIVDRMPDGFIVCDAGGRVVSANAAFLELAQLATIGGVRGEPMSRWIGRTGIDTTVLLGALRKNDSVQRFITQVRGEHGGIEDVEIAGVSVPGADEACFGLTIRPMRRETASPAVRLERSVEQLTGLVGSVPLKELVREATDLIERMCIEAALRLTDNNRASAAELLGVSRQSLYNKMGRYSMFSSGTDPDDFMSS